jgi:spore germination protein YaaH
LRHLLAAALALVCALSGARASDADNRVVFGYYPSWVSHEEFRWDFLTHVGIFSVGLTPTGQISNPEFWRDPATAQIISDAHQHGVKVILTVATFDASAIHALLSSPSARAAAIAALVSEALTSQAGDGLNVDFEQMGRADRDSFTAWIADLRQALHTARPDAELSLALPPVPGAGAYDFAALTLAADRVFVMVYAFHWMTSAPGPIAPLTGSAMWGRGSLDAAIQLYTSVIPEDSRAKIIVGMPLYGYDYPAASADIGAAAVGTAKSVKESSATVMAMTLGRKWDSSSYTPYYVYQANGTWHQCWYDDPESLGLKVDLILARNLGGIGIWALGYEDAAFWQMLANKGLAKDTSPPDGGIGGDSVNRPAGGCAAGGGLTGPVGVVGIVVLARGRRRRS